MIFCIGSRRSNSGTSSRGGSGVSTLSGQRTSPTPHNDHNLENGDVIRSNHHILRTDSSEFTMDSSSHGTSHFLNK